MMTQGATADRRPCSGGRISQASPYACHGPMAWREISRNDWANKFIDELFKGAEISLEKTEGAKMSFFRVEVTGDCALAVKGAGKPRPMFEMKIDLDWKVEQPVDRGKSFAEAKGQIQVTEFSSEDTAAPQMKLICDNQLPPGATPAFQGLMTKLNDAVKSHGMPEVSRMLSQDFVEALKESAAGPASDAAPAAAAAPAAEAPAAPEEPAAA
ncbi:unnamed protein product [Prorocentrum cordatum]|uniref:Activator of Hsp90 ATPase AHSA1-like N-terminal domain-containing protein n=1 Tax=Prorocentrum cordatum TaxID=2364126 RepID=A0ABN9T274_9DINO|nr:unnamed protein product [Polarella glacialis]